MAKLATSPNEALLNLRRINMHVARTLATCLIFEVAAAAAGLAILCFFIPVCLSRHWWKPVGIGCLGLLVCLTTFPWLVHITVRLILNWRVLYETRTPEIPPRKHDDIEGPQATANFERLAKTVFQAKKTAVRAKAQPKKMTVAAPRRKSVRQGPVPVDGGCGGWPGLASEFLVSEAFSADLGHDQGKAVGIVQGVVSGGADPWWRGFSAKQSHL